MAEESKPSTKRPRSASMADDSQMPESPGPAGPFLQGGDSALTGSEVECFAPSTGEDGVPAEEKSNKRARTTSVADVSQVPASVMQAGPAQQDEASAPTGGDDENSAPTGTDDDEPLPSPSSSSEAEDAWAVEVDTSPEREASPSPDRYPPRARGSRERGALDDPDPLSRSAVNEYLRFVFESGPDVGRPRPPLLHCGPITRRRLSALNAQKDMCRVLFYHHRLALVNISDAKAAADIVLNDLREAAAGSSQSILWSDECGVVSDNVRVVRLEYFLSRYRTLVATLTRFIDEERKAHKQSIDNWRTLKSLYRRTTSPVRHIRRPAYTVFFTRLRRVLDCEAS